MKRTVYVYRHSYEAADGSDRFCTLTYLRWQGAGACIHEVEADTGYEAKKIAKREHAEKCGNRVSA